MAGPQHMFCMIVLIGFTSVYSEENSLEIMTSHGPIKGTTQLAPTGKTVDAWYGIPYAQPPVGDLRFRHPRPVEDWTETLDTTEPPNSCHQTIDTLFGDFEGSTMWNVNSEMSEDCLYVTVVVPRPRRKNRAVLVWIYGRGFYSGTSTLDVYDYKTLASEQDVIVVAPQYRVASLGFLYMGTEGVPGNAGLFDQQLALLWIRENIEKFGGNRNNITLFGESAGAASVSMHLLSPMSRPLYSQAIMQSGAANVPWGIISKEESILRGLLLAQALECPHSRDNLQAVVDCLRSANATDLVNNEPATQICEFPFVPIIDGSFFDMSPIESLRTGNFKKTNIIMGSNREEGYWFIMYYLDRIFRREENITVSREDFNMAVESLHPYFDPMVIEAVKFEYTNWVDQNDGHANRNAIDKMVGDYHFTCNVNDFAYYYALHGNNVYMYYFTHRSSQSKWPKWTGVLHGDEIEYLFGKPLGVHQKFTREEEYLSRKMMSYWANFARTGKPSEGINGKWTPYWPPHTVNGREYLELNANHTRTGRGPRLKQCAFWKKIAPKLVHYTEKSPNKGPEQCPRESVQNGVSHQVGGLLFVVSLKMLQFLY